VASSPKTKVAPTSKPTGPMSPRDTEAFLDELYDARQYVEDLEKNQKNLPPTEIVARRQNLPAARQQKAELEKRLEELRGDIFSAPKVAPVGTSAVAAKPDGRMKIQAEAFEHWIRLKASGANPTINSICDAMAKWCADNNVTTKTGVTPRAGTIRNTILGGTTGWSPPTLSRDQAKAHVEQLAQVAQVAQVAQQVKEVPP
jgi:hypothetical protein